MDQITVKNFRCFREKQTVRLAPLTLLVGENSTGKTSFLALIRALWDVAYPQMTPDFKEEPYDLGSFDEIAHHRGARGGRADTFEAGFELKNSYFRFEVTFARSGTVPIPVRRHIANKAVWVEDRLEKDRSWQLRFGTPNGAWQCQFSAYPNTRLDMDQDLPPFFFHMGILQHDVKSRESSLLTALKGPELPTDKDWAQIEKLINTHEIRAFSYLERRTYSSAPVRSKPRRTYDPARPTRNPEGDYIPMYLANAYFQDKRHWNTLKDALEKFGKASGLFDEISVKPLGKKDSEPFQVQIRKFGKRAKGPQRNLIDVGYGVSQVLPVITELLRRYVLDMQRDEDTKSLRPIFLLQQPEVHLHPSAQAALGSLFCQIAGSDRQLVVETHSDHLLDRVRMDVRDGTTNLRPEDVSILFFERGDLDVRIHSLRIDNEGNIVGAPEGYRKFFMEETARSLWKR